MAPRIIISYDDSDNDRDALALGRLLGYSGANLSLAYVRHFPQVDRLLEEQERRQAEELLERGARAIGAPDMARHVVLHASTGQGLLELANREKADVVVFGSEYRTPQGSVNPGTSAQRLLDGGSVAVAIAPAGLRSRSSVSVNWIGHLDGEGDDASETTALSLAAALNASVQAGDEGPVDLLLIGSREGTPAGRVELSATAGYELETATSPVLVVPRGVAVEFASPALSRT
jgi:nucleotide-binding universal stress UspA family protein